MSEGVSKQVNERLSNEQSLFCVTYIKQHASQTRLHSLEGPAHADNVVHDAVNSLLDTRQLRHLPATVGLHSCLVSRRLSTASRATLYTCVRQKKAL